MEQSVESKLTIYFEEPFWVGVFEELDGDKLSVCRMVFGAEPTDAQVWEFILSNYRRLQFSAPIKAEQKQKEDNPKRRQRNARKQMESSGIGTKSQQALQKQYEENKTERKRTTRVRTDLLFGIVLVFAEVPVFRKNRADLLRTVLVML